MSLLKQQCYFIVAEYTKLISVAFKKWSFEASLLTQWLSFIPLSLLQTKHFVCNLRLRFGCFVNCLTHTHTVRLSSTLWSYLLWNLILIHKIEVPWNFQKLILPLTFFNFFSRKWLNVTLIYEPSKHEVQSNE